MKLSVAIPAYNEEGCIEPTVRSLFETLTLEKIDHEIVVVNDNSKDSTGQILEALKTQIPTLVPVFNPGPNGFGMAVRKGLETFTGDAVAVYMADASDRPEDLVRFWRLMEQTNADCVFGTRFHREAKIHDYPAFKLFLNRMVNNFIRLAFGIRYNDVTNAFKLYKRHVIQGVKPFLSPHFNLTVELPLKAIVRGYTYVVTPNDWTNRKAGESKLKIKEMGSRYLFIILYCLIEKWLSRGDFKKRELSVGK